MDVGLPWPNPISLPFRWLPELDLVALRVHDPAKLAVLRVVRLLEYVTAFSSEQRLRRRTLQGVRRAYALSLLLACLAFGCTARPAPCPATAWLATAVEAKRATLDDVKPRYLSMVGIETVPAGARAGVEAWVDEEVRRVRAEAQPNDALWYFRVEKCAGCGWYREGYALIRGCAVVDEITLLDAM